MTVTARKHALLSGISPRPGQMARLYALELASILSWTVLLDTILKLLSGSWLLLLPVSYLFAVTMLAWLERPGPARRENNPLEALGLGEIGTDGSRPSEWQTLRRLLLTPPLLLLLCIGLVPLPGTGRNLLQLASGTKIVPLDESMDPRPDQEIFRIRRKALAKVISYTMMSLMVAAVITFVPPELDRDQVSGRISAVHSLPARERELLADYLEMKAIYPDCLEFHVRLASLYYRNDMKEDLQLELAYIRRRAPDHSILLLEQDLSVEMEDLIVARDTSFLDSIAFTEALPDTPGEPDSVDTGVQAEAPDTAGIIPVETLPDSLHDAQYVLPDSQAASPGDSLPIEDRPEAGDGPAAPADEGAPPSDSLQVEDDETVPEGVQEEPLQPEEPGTEEAGNLESDAPADTGGEPAEDEPPPVPEGP